mgnify:CR=1 FL=1
MKKQILNIGKALSRAEQKLVFGGDLQYEGGDIGCVEVGSLCVVNGGGGEHTSCCNSKKCVSSSGYGTWGLCKE